ncbi:hypothetical protein IQ06DRAFT_57559 [Phaeosphaeriaceae sp. SRC1lsM3a]|nr:hypothetical protein IQ06DRAFT_57559 [Stagonospora sp. SRC1lsM3a]
MPKLLANERPYYGSVRASDLSSHHVVSIILFMITFFQRKLQHLIRRARLTTELQYRFTPLRRGAKSRSQRCLRDVSSQACRLFATLGFSLTGSAYR